MRYLRPNKTKTIQYLTVAALMTFNASIAHASPLQIFDDWIMIASEDDASGAVGGQQFDAEYLFYKMDGTKISIGLQSGFDVDTGKVMYDSTPNNGIDDKNPYYAGDLALSFGGSADVYEYAFDFGLYTEGFYLYPDTATSTLPARDIMLGDGVGGLYSNIDWSDQVNIADSFGRFDHFAMLSGDPVTSANGSTEADVVDVSGTNIYWRTVTFDLNALSGIYDSARGIDIIWTMSCGNDYINGNTNAPVPEPATLLLFGTGLVGLVGLRRRKSRKS